MYRYNHGNPGNLFQVVPLRCKDISFSIHLIIITDISIIDNNSVLYENIHPIGTTVRNNSKNTFEILISVRIARLHNGHRNASFTRRGCTAYGAVAPPSQPAG